MDKMFRDFFGNNVHIVCDDDDVVFALNRELIEPFKENIEYSWMNGKKAEERVKRYLDYIAYWMTKDHGEYGILSNKKVSEIHKYEIQSECPLEVTSAGTVPIEKHKEAKKRTAFQKFESVHEKYPNGKYTTCLVDTCNMFEYGGKMYAIDRRVKQYQFVDTGDDEYFPSDTIVICETDGKKLYFDQEGNAVSNKYIKCVR